MLTAGLLQRMKAGHRAADTAHFVIEEDTNRRRPAAHYIIDKLKGRGRHYWVRNSTAAIAIESKIAVSVPLGGKTLIRCKVKANMTIRGVATANPICASLM